MGAKVRVNWGSLPDTEAVGLHVVYNTAHRSLYVLAADPETAMRIAHTANHVHGTKRIMAENYDRIAFHVGSIIPQMFENVMPELTVAIERRLQGSLHVDDNRLYVGDKLICA